MGSAQGLASLTVLAAEGFSKVLDDFVTRPRVRGPIVHDARVAAICVAHGIEALLTRDRDFSLFPELRTQDRFPVSPELLKVYRLNDVFKQQVSYF
jgi:hypothetical protein